MGEASFFPLGAAEGKVKGMGARDKLKAPSPDAEGDEGRGVWGGGANEFASF